MATLLTHLRNRNWMQVFRLRRLLIIGLFVGMLAIGGLLALRLLRPSVPLQILPGQAVANALVRSMAGSGEVQFVSGAYVPGEQLLLYTRLPESDLGRIRSWAVVQLEPFADELARLPDQEDLTWMIDYGPDPALQELLVVPLQRVREPAFYRYISGAPSLPTSVAVVPTAAAAAPLVVPVPVSTAAPVATAGSVAPTISVAVPSVESGRPGEVTSLLSTGFEGEGSAASLWRPLSGDWSMVDGIYLQRDPNGYDYTTLLDLPPLAHSSIDARLRLVEGAMGGGIVYNAPDLTARNGAQLVDLDRSGAFLRWGHYNEDGTYIYGGGVALDPPLNDEQWHTLRIVTHAAESTVWVDGREIARISNDSTEGYVGLSTSQAQVEFDDVVVLALPEGIDLPLSTSVPMTVTGGLSDDFEDGDSKGWQVLSGAWQSRDGAYLQTSTSGADLSSISLFQGANFTATVRLQWLDGTLGAGVIYNMARRDANARSQIVNYTEDGTLLQWGHFDEGGNFVFEGSAEVPDGSDGEWHSLELRVADGLADFLLDGELVAEQVELTYSSGYLGLLASNGSVAFDDVQIMSR